MRKSKLPFYIAFCLGLLGNLEAATKAPLYPLPFEVKQPNGTVFRAVCFESGDDCGVETTDGYTILRSSPSGYWVYAKLGAEGSLVPSEAIVGVHRPYRIPKHLRNPRPLIGWAVPPRRPDRVAGRALVGDFPALVILVEFQNRSFIGSNPANWRDKVFGSAGSVKAYFRESSFNKLNLVPARENEGTINDGVIRVKLNINHPDTRDNWDAKANKTAIKKALEAADPNVDFSKLDADSSGAVSGYEAFLFVVFAGFECTWGGASGASRPNVWTNWNVFSAGTVPAPKLDGVLIADKKYDGAFTLSGEWLRASWDVGGGCQVQIGLPVWGMAYGCGRMPRLNDPDGSSSGIGNWNLQGGVWNTVRNPGDCPCHLDAWSKYFLGWVQPQPWKGTSKAFTFEPVETASKNSVFILGENPDGPEYGGSGEYFLLENRQKIGFDAKLPGRGLLIWHVDESKTDNSQEQHTSKLHPLVDLEQADGLNTLDKPARSGDDGDPFPGSTGKTEFTEKTAPHSKWYSGKDSLIRVKNIRADKNKIKADLSARG